MKVLQVNVVYQKGSTGKIVDDMHKVLQKKGIESVVCYGRGQKIIEPNVFKTSNEILSKFNAFRARITGLQYNGSFFATKKLINIITNEKPDIVHLHCLNGYFVNIYRLLTFLKNKKIKVVLTLHAEFMHTGNCGHSYDCEKWKSGCGSCPQLWNATRSYYFDRTCIAWSNMEKAFSGFENIEIVGVSEWLADRAKQSPILKQHSHNVIHNGIDIEKVFRPTDFEYLKIKHGLNDEKVILHVTPNFNDETKGGKYLIELAKKMQDVRCKFIIVGLNNIDTTLPNNIITVGVINNQKELASYYSLADLLIITSLRESYPTVCVEAISCGTPVIGFDVGGVKETIYREFGTVVSPFNIDELRDQTLIWMNKKNEIKYEILEMARDYNSKARMVDEYINLYKKLLNVKGMDR